MTLRELASLPRVLLLLELEILLLDILQILQVNQVKLRAGCVDVFALRVQPVECFGLDPCLRNAGRRVEFEAK